jgi:hypothetical protein
MPSGAAAGTAGEVAVADVAAAAGAAGEVAVADVAAAAGAAGAGKQTTLLYF